MHLEKYLVPFTDFFGGKLIILICMLGSIIATFGFALFGLIWFPFMIGFWSLNRFAQSMGWPAIMKLFPIWFEASTHGRLVSLSNSAFQISLFLKNKPFCND